MTTEAHTCPFTQGRLLSLLDLSSPALRDNPYPEYRRYREQDPVHRREPVEPGSDIRYFLTRYADVEACLRDKRLGRQVRAAIWSEDLRTIPPEHLDYARTVREWALFMDPPRHTKVRLTFNRILDDHYMQSLRPHIEALTRGIVRELPATGEFDVIASFAGPLPMTLSRQFLGLENLSLEELSRLMQPIYAAVSGHYTHERLAAASTAIRTLNAHFDEIIARRRSGHRGPGDFVDRVLQFTDEERLLMEHQVLPTCHLLLSATMENVVNMIGNGILTLLRHPDQLSLLLNRPGLMPQAVKEILRYESPVQQMTRHALNETRIGGKLIEKGAAVSCLFGAANRDPEVFPDPDCFDITRPATHNTAFGFGIHHCPGANLSLLQGEVALAQFFDWFPSLTLMSQQGEWKTSEAFRGLKRLPVRHDSRVSSPPSSPSA